MLFQKRILTGGKGWSINFEWLRKIERERGEGRETVLKIGSVTGRGDEQYCWSVRQRGFLLHEHALVGLNCRDK